MFMTLMQKPPRIPLSNQTMAVIDNHRHIISESIADRFQYHHFFRISSDAFPVNLLSPSRYFFFFFTSGFFREKT